MAEIVEYRLEKTLQEIDILIKFGLFTDDEAREVTKKREEFEYALRRRTNDKLCYLKYIKFEMNMLAAIEKYKDTIRKVPDDKIFELQAQKLKEIVRSRIGHISFLYRKVIMKNQFDKRLWVAYIEFAKQRKLIPRVSALYWRMLRVVNNDASLWIDAAEFEISITKDLNVARKLLLLGLRHNPESRTIKEKLATICDTAALKESSEDIDTIIEESAPSTSKESKTKHKSMIDVLYERFGKQKDLEATRKLFDDLEKSVKNQTLALYVGMIEIESKPNKLDKDRIRTLYDKALSKFGKCKPKLWYEYLRFENKHAKTLEDFERINRVYTRAQATLDPSKVGRVISQYTLMQSGQEDEIYSDYSDLD